MLPRILSLVQFCGLERSVRPIADFTASMSDVVAGQCKCVAFDVLHLCTAMAVNKLDIAARTSI